VLSPILHQPRPGRAERSSVRLDGSPPRTLNSPSRRSIRGSATMHLDHRSTQRPDRLKFAAGVDGGVCNLGRWHDPQSGRERVRCGCYGCRRRCPDCGYYNSNNGRVHVFLFPLAAHVFSFFSKRVRLGGGSGSPKVMGRVTSPGVLSE
jgi:hypothetical protein